MAEHCFKRWQKQHPEFSWEEYSSWVAARGYYRYALDISKPEFYEYATVFLNQQMANRRLEPAS